MDCNLITLLQYRNAKVVAHFCHHNPHFSLAKGEELFTDLMRWMWLNQQRAKQGKKTYLFGPLLVLDDLWHTFILHTRDYVDFCQHYFGDYFHHDVEPMGFEHHLDERALTDFLQDGFLYVGSEWVERCFAKALHLS